MTREKWKSMTARQRRLKIAQLVGWKWRPTVWWMRWLWGPVLTQPPGAPEWQWFCGYIPRYATDLNVLRVAVAQLINTPGLEEAYMLSLGRVCDCYSGGPERSNRDWEWWSMRMVNANADQRAEALVLTLESEET